MYILGCNIRRQALPTRERNSLVEESKSLEIFGLTRSSHRWVQLGNLVEYNLFQAHQTLFPNLI